MKTFILLFTSFLLMAEIHAQNHSIDIGLVNCQTIAGQKDIYWFNAHQIAFNRHWENYTINVQFNKNSSSKISHDLLSGTRAFDFYDYEVIKTYGLAVGINKAYKISNNINVELGPLLSFSHNRYFKSYLVSYDVPDELFVDKQGFNASAGLQLFLDFKTSKNTSLLIGSNAAFNIASLNINKNRLHTNELLTEFGGSPFSCKFRVRIGSNGKD